MTVAPFTKADAERAGWQFRVDEHQAYATNTQSGKEVNVPADAGAPLFLLLANVAERMGQGFAAGYGGDLEITGELIAAVSGEDYEPPVFEPPTPGPSATDVIRGIDQALSQLDPETATLADVIGAVRAVTSQV